MKYLVVDRIEAGFAVCEDSERNMREIPLEELPESLREGDCIFCGDGRYVIDSEETQRRREENIRLLQMLMKKD